VAGTQGETLNTAVATGQELKRVYANVRMVFQDPYGSLDPRMPVSEVIGEPLELLTSLSPAEREARVDELLEAVGLEPDVRNRYVHSFSGGQRQRIGIARALATDPSVLIADEAVSALDVSVQAQVLNLLKDLQTRRRLGMLFVSHDIGVVASICQRVAVMYAGRIVEVASKDHLFTRPRHPYTSLLLGAVLPPDPGHERPRTAGVEDGVADPANLPAGCAFAARCAFASDLCHTKVPELRELDGVQVACHHAETVELPAPRVDVPREAVV
jgi:peptide/nickel transport system ATP-binding protein